MLGDPDAVLIVDDTTLLKRGRYSVGVARQYSGAAGKRANCQCVVSLTLAAQEAPLPVALRLFLPEEWTRDPSAAAVRVRVAGGPLFRGSQHLPGGEIWPVAERRHTGERKYYLSNLSTQTPLRTLAALIKARWSCEQAHQRKS